jgi:hypothetical protein
MRRPFRARRLLWLIPLLLLLGVAWQIASMREVEETALARAQQHFDRRELEAALEALQPFTRREMRSSGGRRRAALLFFQLGEDRQAHRLLLLQRPDEKSQEDKTLQEWAARCQRAQNYANMADKLKASKNFQQRRDLIEAALAETPDAPKLLQRLVEEDLMLMSVSKDPAGAEQFERDYLELRTKAPGLAAQVKEGAERSLEKMER